MKKISVMFSLFLLGLGLIGCNNQEEVEGNGEIYVDQDWDIYSEGHLVEKNEQIDYWSANSAVDLHGVAMADMVADFNAYQKEAYPDSAITVKVAFQNGYNNQNSKLQAALIGNTNPEIAMVGVSSMALYVNNAIDMRNIYTYDQIRNIQEGFLQFAMYKHKFPGYPYFAATNLYIVNRTLMEATGKKIPTVDEIIQDPKNSIWTWDYFKEVVEAARSGENYGAAITDIGLYEAFYSQGVPVYNEECTEPMFNNEYGIKAFQYWQDIVKSGDIKNPLLDPNHGTKSQGDFVAGKVGMLSASSSLLKNMHTSIVQDKIDAGQEPLFEIDVLPHPKYTDFYSNQSGGGLLIFNNKNDSKTKAAVEFLRWMTADEQVARYSMETGYLPSTKSSIEIPAWKEFIKTNDLMHKAVQMMVFTPPNNLKVPIGRAKALADNDFKLYSRGIWMDNYTRKITDVLKECEDRVAYILSTNS